MMNANIFTQVVHSLGWAILHSLWLGLAAAVVLYILLNLFKQSTPLIRYHISVLTGLVLFFSIGYVFVGEYLEQSSSVEITFGTHSGYEAQTTNPQNHEPVFRQILSAIGQTWRQYTPLVVAIWFIGALFFAGRLAVGYSGLVRLSTKQTFAPPKEWSARLQVLAKEAGINRSVRLLVSQLTEGPVTLWHFRPLILIPAGMLSGMSPDHVEALLMHELAHIRRADFLVNLFQSFIETVLFYHPAMWWISGRIRDLREECCDDRVLATGRDVHIYAEALTQAYSFYLSPKPQLIMSATEKNGHFTARIQRLFGITQPTTKTGKNLLSLVILLTGFVTFAFHTPPQPQPLTAAIPELPFIQPFTPTPSLIASVEPESPAATMSQPVIPATIKEEFRVVIHSGMTREDLAALKADLKTKDIDLIINEEEYTTSGKLSKVVGRIKFPDGNSGNFSGSGTNMRVEITRTYENGKGSALNIWVGSGAGTQPAIPTPPTPPVVNGTATITAAPATASSPGAPAAVTIHSAAPGAPAAVSITPATPVVPATPAAPAVPATPAVPPIPDVPAVDAIDGNSIIQIRPETDTPPLFILNGKKQEDDSMIKTLDPDMIESVFVLKGKKATKKYGEAGANGVILIETKKEKK
ncbi:MAG: M56 family metallopeptidase [Bacteroidia bacterium]